MSWNKPAVKGAAPSARHSTAIAFIAGKVILFGGTHEKDAYNDLWSLDINTWTWTKIEAKGTLPSPRWGHSANVVGKYFVIFGGEAVGGKTSEMFLLDVETQTWSTPTNTSGAGPNARAYHATVAHENKLYVFGGDGGDNAMYVLDTTTFVWQRLATTGYNPQNRKKHSLTLFGSELFVFGGVDLNNYQFLNDIHTVNLKTLEWVQQAVKGPVAEARGGHTSTVLASKVFIWGGASQKDSFNELHYCDPDDKYLWFKKKGMGSVPAPRQSHAATLIGEKWLVFGGLDNNTRNPPASNDVYVLTPSGIY